MLYATSTIMIDARARVILAAVLTPSANKARVSLHEALGPCRSLVHKRHTLAALPDVSCVRPACMPGVVAYSRVPAAAAVLRLRGTSEMAMLAAMCMMAVERSRGGYARV